MELQLKELIEKQEQTIRELEDTQTSIQEHIETTLESKAQVANLQAELKQQEDKIQSLQASSNQEFVEKITAKDHEIESLKKHVAE